nr:ABC transporter ATP-binding protein [Acidobacteriota bacterium]
DLTGRENIYLQGSIMGMSRKEISKREEEIIDFAGVGAFVDTPVKRYSSGMNARLGFAIAAHLDPDVLIIDEVLSVGDMSFQEKCIRRMKEFKRQGAAIAFVSHNLPAVVDLCDRVLVLRAGSTGVLGSTGDAVEFYLGDQGGSKNADPADATAVLTYSRLENHAGQVVRSAVPGEHLSFSAEVLFNAAALDVSFGLIVYDGASGIKVAAANSASLGLAVRDFLAGERVGVRFAFTANLAQGQYLVEFHAATAATMTMHVLAMPAAMLRIEENVSPFGVAFLAFEMPSLEFEAGADEPSLVATNAAARLRS